MFSFNFSENYILEDERVKLLPLQMEDFEHLLPFSETETDIFQFSSLPVIGGENLKKYMGATINERIKKNEYPFVVFDKKANAYAGTTRFYDIQLISKTLQLGYTWYGQNFHRTGLNRHCKMLLLTFAFEKMGMERVEFRADANNQKSINAMKNIGCVVEGILRSAMPKLQGGRRDSIILSILKDEWYGGVKEKLAGKIDYLPE